MRARALVTISNWLLCPLDHNTCTVHIACIILAHRLLGEMITTYPLVEDNAGLGDNAAERLGR